MTTASTAVVGVVLQLHRTTPIDSSLDCPPGTSPIGTLVLGPLDGSGVTVVVDDLAALERLGDEVRRLVHAFRDDVRREQEDVAWAEHDRVLLTARGRAAVGPALQLVRS